MGIRLLVGLGNPGREYADTRHNAGFWLAERLADQHGASLSVESRFHGRVATIRISGHPLMLLLPQTYMNHSGRAVGALARFHRLAPEDILVVHDELDLPPGGVRLKQGGGHAGHNGLRDIHANLGSPDYWRLRLGIGHPGDRARVADYVLHPPGRDDAIAIDVVIDACLAEIPVIVAGQTAAAMQKLHTGR
jgi:peptidyl-tRNA hydrolase, PTH1 family